MLTSEKGSTALPSSIVPSSMHNDGNYIVSLGNVVRWLAEQAESLEVMMFPSFAASDVLYHEDGSVRGVVTGDMGLNAQGEPKTALSLATNCLPNTPSLLKAVVDILVSV